MLYSCVKNMARTAVIPRKHQKRPVYNLTRFPSLQASRMPREILRQAINDHAPRPGALENLVTRVC